MKDIILTAACCWLAIFLYENDFLRLSDTHPIKECTAEVAE